MAWDRRGIMTPRPQRSDNRPLIVAVAIIPTLVLSMVVTWFLYDRYSLPDDNAISLGLLGSVFVALYALFLLVFLVGTKAREGQYAAAAKGGLLILGLGLLIAPVVGALPWSMRWLWNSSPWVPFLLRALFAIWVIVWLIRIRKLPRESRYLSLYSLTLLTYLMVVIDSSIPRLVRYAVMLLMFVGLIWRWLATWKQRRARASAAGSA